MPAKKTSKKVTRKPAKKPAKSVTKKAAKLSAIPRNEMIAKAAYYRAEKRSFQDGDPVADWLSSERQIDKLLAQQTQ